MATSARSALLAGVLVVAGGAVAHAGEAIFASGFEARIVLNDSGIVWSGANYPGNATFCDAADPAGQDCHYGRDALAAVGLLTKVGASAPNNGISNGFDYSKVANDGSVVPVTTPLGSDPKDWACTRDNVTGLIWEVKTDDGGLRDKGWTYSWYDVDSPDGNPGTADGGHCATAGHCDTQSYVADVNAIGLCGHSDWRMPSIGKLQGLVDYGRAYPAIDPFFFPNTPPSSDFWSGSPNASSSNGAWGVYFGDGYAGYYNRNYSFRVRLVRGGQ